MKKIRIGIFETNSSSSHSFSIGKKNLKNDLKLNRKKEIIVPFYTQDDFPNKTNSAEKKASYLCLFISTFHNFKKKSAEYLEDINRVLEVIKEYTGAKDVKYKNKGREYDSIDHESNDILDERDFRNKDFIKNFIFSENSWLYVVWDSESFEDDFYEPLEFEKPEILCTLEYEFKGLSETLKFNITNTYTDLYDNITDELIKIKYNINTDLFEKIDIDEKVLIKNYVPFGKGKDINSFCKFKSDFSIMFYKENYKEFIEKDRIDVYSEENSIVITPKLSIKV